MSACRPVMKDQAWPADGLEHVPDCPVCGSNTRTLLHEGLSDQIFFVAPGEWSLWRCSQCRSAWLDPRPTKDTIGLAYREYYTHEPVDRSVASTAFQRLRAALGNGYRNSRYGTRLEPSLAAGRLLAELLPPLKWPIDVAYRFFPKAPSGQPGRVLDIGCGNGDWLEMARDTGWDVAGAEPDAISRGQARDRGFDVRESVTEWLGEPQSFDFVTMSHVIEHVHEPLQLLRDAHSLLRPGGSIYIDTPNIDATGHQLYGGNWRGLEPPRHLVIFNRESLKRAVGEAGFGRIRYRARFYPAAGMSQQSRRIASCLDPCAGELPDSPWSGANIRSAFSRRRSEFLTLTAMKR